MSILGQKRKHKKGAYLEKVYYVNDFLFDFKEKELKEHILRIGREQKKEIFYEDLNNSMSTIIDEKNAPEFYNRDTETEYLNTPVSKELIDVYFDEEGLLLHVYEGLKMNLIRDFEVYEYRKLEVVYNEKKYTIVLVYYRYLSGGHIYYNKTALVDIDVFLPRCLKGVPIDDIVKREDINFTYLHFERSKRSNSFSRVCIETTRKFKEKYGTDCPHEYYLGKKLSYDPHTDEEIYGDNLLLAQRKRLDSENKSGTASETKLDTEEE